MGEVIQLHPRKHLNIQVFEHGAGFRGEAIMNGELLWEYETDKIDSLRMVIQRTVGNQFHDPK